MFLSVFSSGSGIQQVTFEGSGDSFEKGLSPEAVADGQQAHERGLGIAVISPHVMSCSRTKNSRRSPSPTRSAADLRVQNVT